MPTQTKENYLKAIFSISQKGDTISITALSEAMEVSKPTVNNMVKKLEEKGWVLYEKYKPLKLTPKGKKEAALIVRKHRLAEMFLADKMGFGWEEVHDIAEEMEHLHSDKLFERMDEMLGFPTIDPHGSPIPDKTGNILDPKYLKLPSIQIGETVKLSGLANSTKELLLYLNKKGLELGSRFQVKQIESFDNSTEVVLENKMQSITLSAAVCQCLLVEKI